MLQIFITLIVLGLLSITFVIVGENYVDKLSDKSTFKKWWRRNIVATDPKDKI